ncbi:MAG: lipoate-protein ligase A [Mariniblastus sp.]|jgi:lipoate-protein ligase A
MKLLDLTLDPAVANIALDEALVEAADAKPDATELLRLWEPTEPMVVLGRSSPAATEANLDFCQQHQIEVFRRCSGGQSIVTGPGCLMYALLLDYRKRPELRMLEYAHQFVMQQMQAAIGSLGVTTDLSGTSDLTYQGRKFSGNALRCKQDWLIYHGTMICDFEIEWIANCLGQPIRQPNYRADRSHQEFLTQLPVSTQDLAVAIANQWQAFSLIDDWPEDLTAQLVNQKYSSETWTYKVR